MSTLSPQCTLSPAISLSSNLRRGIAVGVLLAVSGCILGYAVTIEKISNRDYISYWAAGQQLIHGGNPYDANQIFEMERSAGRDRTNPIIMRNAPLGLFLTIPLGGVTPKIGYMIWALLSLCSWLLSVHLVWIMNGRRDSAVQFIGYLFVPALACFLLGQSSLFVLLGLTLFLYFHITRPTLAGAALLFCALKPHLFLPFGVALLAWIFARKAYRVLAGAVFAMGIACALPLVWNPSIYSQYAAMARISGIKAEFIPTLSQALRSSINPDAFWIQFLPSMAACIWAVWYFHRHSHNWDWLKDGSLLMLVSLTAAPYAWYFDKSVLIPAVLYAAYRARPAAVAILCALLALDGIQVQVCTSAHSRWFIWPSAAWLIWYVYSTARSHTSPNLFETQQTGS